MFPFLIETRIYLGTIETRNLKCRHHILLLKHPKQTNLNCFFLFFYLHN